jgi:hypothetical protein
MPQPPIFFNRLGDATQVGNSVVGLNFSWTGTPAYAAGKFGNGIDITYSGGEYISNGSWVYYPQGCHEFWLKPDNDYNSGSNVTYFYDWRSSGGTGNPSQIIYYNYGAQIWSLWNPNGAGNGIFETQYNDTTSFSGGDLLHLAHVWDAAGIDGGSDTHRFYINGSRMTATAGSEATAIHNINIIGKTMRIGQSVGANQGAVGVIDNFKTYDWTKTYFTDRGNERGGLDDQVI